jgi:hypothetical protein
MESDCKLRNTTYNLHQKYNTLSTKNINNLLGSLGLFLINGNILNF